ncbi:IS630 family transposase [Chitinispirillales bacterium ANBcel5]|uniref:IS630 family transposase n=1 Tax=Cellulosispirillum alkaliphilum TaxID=3039283 RepID=UPI002A586639|nr:IS630 family transposase [Chitinispirillales bacterium ANBcel5]
MAKTISIIELTSDEIKELSRRTNSSLTSKRDHTRAQIILMRSKGMRQIDVSKKLNVSVACVNKWCQRFEREGLNGLIDKKGRGRKESLPLSKVEKIITSATQPPKPLKRWSTRKMAEHVGVSHSTVRRIWNKNELKPHIQKTFKISTDKDFEKKFWDVIGLYLDPPEKSLVLCCDEKSQCQALERTQLSLPLGLNGYVKTTTHDYKRHGTVTLFAALHYLEGKIISRIEQKHTHVEWLRFLKQINRETPKDLTIHIIADNYCTHKHEKVIAWLEKNPRFKIHFTPTGSSWMNLVERFLRDISEECIRYGSFSSVKELENDIYQYLEQRNQSPRKYSWNADGEKILEKIQRARAKLENVINST